MIRKRITKRDLEIFRLCQEKERSDWWATFSVQPDGDIFPFAGRGWTYPRNRTLLRAHVPVLAEVADIYLRVRPDGGRLFIDKRGVFFHATELGPDEQFIVFDLLEFVPKNIGTPRS